MQSVCIVELHITYICIKILIVAQKCFYGKFMSQLYVPVLERNYIASNLHVFTRYL